MDHETDEPFKEAWAAGKPTAVTVLARVAVTTIGPLRDFMEQRRLRQGLFALEPNVEERLWLSFYRRQSLVRGCAETLFPEEAEVAQRAYRVLLNPRSASQAEQQELLASVLLLFSPSESPQAASLQVSLAGFDDPEFLAENPGTPAFEFLLRVTLPCVFAYGVLPDHLLWKTAGDDDEIAEEAVQRLVRLDGRAARHPLIQRWIVRDGRVAPYRAEKIRKWQASRTPFDKPKSDSHWLKFVFGLLSRVSELCDSRLTEPELRALALLMDEDLPADLHEYVVETTNDDLSREIRRKRPLFDLPAQPDRSAFAAVRALVERLP